MCLLVVLFRVDPAAPLVIAANRDEYLARPAVAMTALGCGGPGPRILGGRDDVSGGTWLAVNDGGVVAGLTNRPLPDGPDRAKRSRGELPLRLASHRSAAAAVDAFVEGVRPTDYNPAWLLVGDRDQLFYVDVTSDHRVEVEELAPGVHVLENRDLHDPSPKVERVRGLLAPLLDSGRDRLDRLADGLADLLRDHDLPPVDERQAAETTRLGAAVRSICVHAPDDDYGTRSSAIITVAADERFEPDVRYTDGAPCLASWEDARHLW